MCGSRAEGPVAEVASVAELDGARSRLPSWSLPSNADRPGQLREALHDVRDTLEEVDARGALLDDVDRHLPDRDAATVGADDELAGEHVFLDETRPDDVEQ